MPGLPTSRFHSLVATTHCPNTNEGSSRSQENLVGRHTTPESTARLDFGADVVDGPTTPIWTESSTLCMCRYPGYHHWSMNGATGTSSTGLPPFATGALMMLLGALLSFKKSLCCLCVPRTNDNYAPLATPKLPTKPDD